MACRFCRTTTKVHALNCPNQHRDFTDRVLEAWEWEKAHPPEPTPIRPQSGGQPAAKDLQP